MKIFNTEGNDKDRQVWFGNSTNLMNLNNVKYSWAVDLYKQMRENFWIPDKIDVTQDVMDYNNLTANERFAYEHILSYLTFLDSIQTINLPYLKSPITAPEINLCISEQISQEAMHNASYQVLIEAIIPSDKRESIYEMWREDDILRQRCEFIAKYYQSYLDDPSEKNYFTALFADYLLEGIYFYNGFTFFYNLASRMLMPGTSDMIKMINRDELSHVRLYQKLLTEALQGYDPDISEWNDMVRNAVEWECTWTNHIIKDILGITEESTRQYTQFLANARLKSIGMYPIYDSASNPYSHLERLSDTKSDGGTKANFFETTVTSYVQSSAIEGWEIF